MSTTGKPGLDAPDQWASYLEQYNDRQKPSRARRHTPDEERPARRSSRRC
jgi:hypothetical protein